MIQLGIDRQATVACEAGDAVAGDRHDDPVPEHLTDLVVVGVGDVYVTCRVHGDAARIGEGDVESGNAGREPRKRCSACQAEDLVRLGVRRRRDIVGLLAVVRARRVVRGRHGGTARGGACDRVCAGGQRATQARGDQAERQHRPQHPPHGAAHEAGCCRQPRRKKFLQFAGHPRYTTAARRKKEGGHL